MCRGQNWNRAGIFYAEKKDIGKISCDGGSRFYRPVDCRSSFGSRETVRGIDNFITGTRANLVLPVYIRPYLTGFLRC